MRKLILALALIAPPTALLLALLHHPGAAALVFIGGGVLLMTPVFRPNVQWFGPVITHFETSANEVWLTIDDGPTGDTDAVLDMLDSHRVRATFFVKGMLVTPAIIERIQARGHTIGNHSQTHPAGTFWCLPPAAIAREIDGCAAVIPPTPLFRAPVGTKNPFVHPLLAARGMMLVAFSARAFDAVLRSPRLIAAAIARQLHPGAIVVLHQGRPWSIESIARTIERAVAAGYSFVVPEAGRLKTKR